MSNARKLADNLPSVGQLSGRNIIINGGMTIAQRQVQSTNAADGYRTLDRFFHELKNATDNLTYTTEQVTDAPSGFSKSLKLTVTTAESALAADEFGRIYYVAEGQDLQRIGYGTSACKEVTLSFYVKSSITGNFSASIYLAASGGVISSQAYTINSANTWERKTLTFPTYTTANVPNTNAAGMYLNFGLFAGSNYNTLSPTFIAHTGAHLLGGQAANFTAVNGTTWQLTGVQLETGSQSSPFEHEPVGVTLSKCQRYYFGPSIRVHMNSANSNNWNNADFVFPTQMRATRTMTSITNAGSCTLYSTGVYTQNGQGLHIYSSTQGAHYVEFTADAEL